MVGVVRQILVDSAVTIVVGVGKTVCIEIHVLGQIDRKYGGRTDLMAAAWNGEMKKAISGTASMPRPPPKPLFEIPVINTAAVAAT